MRKVRVYSRKYDGAIRDEYEPYLYDETDEIIILFSLAGLPHWDRRKGAWIPAPDGYLEIFFKRKWYNVLHIAVQNSNTNLMYVNIAIPPTLHGEILEWVDLDLDYRVHMDNSIARLDEDEFQQNAQRLRYPPDLIKQTQAACREVEGGLKQRIFPFDYERQVELYYRIRNSLQSV